MENPEDMNIHSDAHCVNDIDNTDATNLQENEENLAEDLAQKDNLTAVDDKPVESEQNEKEAEPSLEEKHASLNDSYLRLMAEYDNYRKRTIREKADLIKSGGESVLKNILPVVDDFDRALETLKKAGDMNPAIEGVQLIYDKFISFLLQFGVKKIDAIGNPFDAEMHEAIAAIPAPDEDKKGKIIDCIQSGYTMYDKVLRYAKVVVGE